MTEDNTAEMAPAWREALARHLATPTWSPIRQRQAQAAGAIKGELKSIVWLRELRARYQYDNQTGLAAMRRLFPGQQWWTSDLREPRDLAYALRHVELATGHQIDATKPLPWWVREWT